jgi:hypothetical protein
VEGIWESVLSSKGFGHGILIRFKHLFANTAKDDLNFAMKIDQSINKAESSAFQFLVVRYVRNTLGSILNK